MLRCRESIWRGALTPPVPLLPTGASTRVVARPDNAIPPVSRDRAPTFTPALRVPCLEVSSDLSILAASPAPRCIAPVSCSLLTSTASRISAKASLNASRPEIAALSWASATVGSGSGAFSTTGSGRTSGMDSSGLMISGSGGGGGTTISRFSGMIRANCGGNCSRSSRATSGRGRNGMRRPITTTKRTQICSHFRNCLVSARPVSQGNVKWCA